MKLSALQLATQLVDTLPVGRPGLFNPWRQSCTHDRPINTTEQKLARLAAHLDCNAKLILVGEAPGYQGGRYSGVAITSERLLLEGMIPRMPALQGRLTDRAKPFSEPSATIVWGKLQELGIAGEVILWNSVRTTLITLANHTLIARLREKNSALASLRCTCLGPITRTLPS